MGECAVCGRVIGRLCECSECGRLVCDLCREREETWEAEEDLDFQYVTRASL